MRRWTWLYALMGFALAALPWMTPRAAGPVTITVALDRQGALHVTADPPQGLRRTLGPLVIPPRAHGDVLALRPTSPDPGTRYLIVRLDTKVWFYELAAEVQPNLALDLAYTPIRRVTTWQPGDGRQDWLIEIERYTETTPCTNAPPTTLQVGGLGHTCHPRKILLWSRASPRSHVLASLEPGTRFEVIGGPECGAQRIWWKVRLAWPYHNLIGWMPETSVGGVQRYLCPGEP